jgi:nucleoside transporter
MNSSPKLKLFVMMVLQFFIWGAWLPPVFGYMPAIGFTGPQQALVGSAFAIASLVGIFFSNQFVDRNFSAERFLALSHVVGGLAMLGLFFVKDFTSFFALMLVHSLFYVPTISVTNSIAFTHMKDAQQEFGIVRMGGTIGWIAAQWPLYFILGGLQGDDAIRMTRWVFVISAVASFLLASFSLALPHTPPKPAQSGEDSLAWLKAARRLRYPFLMVLFLVTFIDATVHNGYFVFVFNFLAKIGIEPKWITPITSIGQIAEILTMAVLGLSLARLGWKLTMIIGILGHSARFAVFAFFPDNHAIIIAVQVLHGICYAFFFATLYIFIDAAFPKDVRTSAQGLVNLLILGAGDLAAKWIFIPLTGHFTTNGVTDFKSLFLIPTGMALVGAVILALAFSPPKDLGSPEDAPPKQPH